MASYSELFDLRANGDMRNRVAVAIVIAANDIFELATPTTAQKAWAAAALANPGNEADKAWKAILAANKSASVAQILAATDSTIQTNVNAIVPILVDVLAGV